MELKCMNQAAGLRHSNAKAAIKPSIAPIKHIKAVREISAGYAFSVIAYKSNQYEHINVSVLFFMARKSILASCKD
ncbi:hypothetical protein L484_025383 [Morus notabilis]|uniref:Uncharacterized protein n=1 Tax=Morus notabilis TaxID=981085 RepID=W9RAG7_9ROSA|nr:hypothetical protein L484_025383 [Morus notabilis]